MYIPTIRPVLPIMPRLINVENINAEIVMNIICAMLVIGLAVLVGWVLTRVMKSKGVVCNQIANMIGSGAIALGLFIRFGLSVTLLQGLFLMFVLLYASMSDLTSHTMDDFLWVMIFALSLVSIPTLGVTSMIAGAFCVFIPQWAMALLPPHKTLGGADIKLSTALAFLLGFPRGIFAYLIGLAVAVVYMLIYNKVKKRCAKKPFALVPFLSIGAMILFFV